MMYESRGENNRREMSVSPIRPDITFTHLYSDERERDRSLRKKMAAESAMSLCMVIQHTLIVCNVYVAQNVFKMIVFGINICFVMVKKRLYYCILLCIPFTNS